MALERRGDAPLDANEHNKIRRARAQLERRKPGLGTPDDLVTELSFGFWVWLLSRGRAYAARVAFT